VSITTYSELQTAIADFLDRDDLASVVPTFIRLAESRLNRDLRTWKQEVRSVATLDEQYSGLPPDFAQPIRLQITDGPTSEVEPISTALLLELRSERNDRPGRPTHYAITAQGIELYPTPDQAYTASLVYYAKIPALSGTTTSNWLLTDAPDVYLYGALVHSAPYLQDDPRIAVWEGLHASGVTALNDQSVQAKYGGSGLIMRTRR
jgi:hypothetical protein